MCVSSNHVRNVSRLHRLQAFLTGAARHERETRRLVTRRKLPKVEDRLRRDYDARLNPDDRLYSKDELIAGARARPSCPVTPNTSRPTSSSNCCRGQNHRQLLGRFDHVDVEAARKKGSS
jgi:hypothetical protein